jgi:hypothetical protein
MSPPVERATDVAAVGAVTSPLWLQDISSFFAAILPIIGAAWLIIQIYHRIKHWDPPK